MQPLDKSYGLVQKVTMDEYQSFTRILRRTLPIGVLGKSLRNSMNLGILQAFPKCVLKWIVCDDDGSKITEASKTIDVGSDSAIRICDFSLELKADTHYNVILQLDDSPGKC